MHNSIETNETIIINSDQVVQSTAENFKLGVPYTKNTRIYNYIPLAKALENLNDPSKSHLNKELYLDIKDQKTQEFVNSIQKGLAEYTGNDSVDVRLRGKEDKSFTAWVSLKDGKEGELKFDNSFPGEALKNSNPKIGAFTLVSPEDKRLARVSQNDDGVRLYQILNGSSTIKFNWKVDDRDCSITFTISRRDDGKGNDNDYDVVCTDMGDNTSFDDLKKNEAVKIKIGYYENKNFDKYNDMTLTKLALLDRNLQGVEASEVLTNLTSANTQQVQAAAGKSAN
ncbi:hypothetical protein [Wolbachia endosymbiont of Folsomia candida]|uniref:hypothetical protein n=1 Tax=Wolbachia endosymbiont of Folsomia candida TaxID=169402 RepID=UPI000AD76E1E|nr:hypothetical protein [Wolbachia endosymbiont of Folsomia candida]APR99112.1 hypothetical protein ASM33_08000 [Wolbachia endosymbiont of Folsomia candida]